MTIHQTFTVLVLCPAAFHQQMTVALSDASDKFQAPNDRRQVILKFCSTAEDLASLGGADTNFVVIVIDSTTANNSTMCRQQLLRLAPTFANSRMILVNGGCRSGMLSTTKELVEIAEQFKIPYVNAELLDAASCKLTSEKILKLASTVCGYETGVPVVIPTTRDFFPFSL